MHFSLEHLVSIKRTGYSAGTDRAGELCFNFSITNNLSQLVNFPTWIPDCDSHSPAYLHLFIYFAPSTCSTMTFPPFRNSDHIVVSVSIDFPTNPKWDVLFHRLTYDYSCADWDGLCGHLRDDLWVDIFKLSSSSAASAFCEWVQVGIDVYTPHCKYQVKPHSSPWLSAACAATIVHRNHFFSLYQQDISYESKVKFRQQSSYPVIADKRFLKLPNLHMLLKQKSSSLSRNLTLGTFGKSQTMFSTKVNLLYLLYSTACRCCLVKFF